MDKRRIRHQVLFDLKSGPQSEATERFLRDGRTQLTSIPGVGDFSVFRQVSPKNDYQFGFSMEFADEAAYQVYNAHPVHTAFVRERWQTEVSRFLEIDLREV